MSPSSPSPTTVTKIPEPDCSHRTRTNVRHIAACYDLSGNLIAAGEVGPVERDGHLFTFPLLPLPETDAHPTEDPH